MPKHPFGVLIIHGFTASLDCVREIEPPLKALGLPTRMPVLRGHGAESPEALRGVKWQDWFADAEAALKDLLTVANKAIIIGHSMGGLMTLLLAGKYAAHIDSIIVAAAAVQLTSPMAPGRPLHFIAPIVTRILKKWDMPPVYADPTLAQYDTNYAYAPMDAVKTLLDCSKYTRTQLDKVTVPTLIIHSHKDTSVAEKSVAIIHDSIATPAADKKIAWFDQTEHEMFRDCERYAIIDVIKEYVKGRIG